MILQLDPPIPLFTDKGEALAHFLIDYGPESHLHWVCFLKASGEIWTLDNTRVRAQWNQTLGRRPLAAAEKSVPPDPGGDPRAGCPVRVTHT